MFNLGLLYDEGHGVAQDYAKAREWYEKGADKGDTTAMKRMVMVLHRPPSLVPSSVLDCPD
jgi:TPR repeat protein